jgi:hypothetical protein
MATPYVTPTLYQLSGAGLHVTYATSGIDGQPHVHYQDSMHNENFKGNQIRVVECDVGTLVSVTIQMTVDSGSTTFSMLIPRINLNKGEIGTLKTDGITTVHRFSIVPTFMHGQIDHYSIAALHGTAQQVFF